jgi:hypothetical protein
MKAFYESRRKTVSAGLASSFSLSEKLARKFGKLSHHDEHSQIGILTSGFEPLFRLPNSASGTSGIGNLYPVTVAQPSRIFTGFPGFGHDGWRTILSLSKNGRTFNRENIFANNKLKKLSESMPLATDFVFEFY